MNSHFLRLLIILIFVAISNIKAVSQGPPITADKPIMLGSKSWILKTLTEIRSTNSGVLTRIPVMVHYLPTSNSLVAVHMPLVTYDFDADGDSGSAFGDIDIMAKYQFYRLDKMGKTFRVVAKTIQTLPTGKDLGLTAMRMSTDTYQGYYALVVGYETIKYGISTELGLNTSADERFRELRYKLGFGLPLLKPVYPVDQLNLYFEYQSNWFMSTDNYMLFFAQGIQYAKGRLTLEAAVQLPLAQNIVEENKRKLSIFLGTRYVF